MRVLAGPVATPARRRAGDCIWVWHWEDVDLRCVDSALPGEELCADHFIELAQKTGGEL